MKGLLAAGLSLLLLPALAGAQDKTNHYREQGYLFLGFGTGTGSRGLPNFFHQVGVGGEGFLYKGFGFGGEVGYASWSYGDAWVGSVDFSYHLRRRARQGMVDPFGEGGFSVLAPSSGYGRRGQPAGNFGGGANIWLGKRDALRLEFRDVVGLRPGYYHVVSFRIGLTFR